MPVRDAARAVPNEPMPAPCRPTLHACAESKCFKQAIFEPTPWRCDLSFASSVRAAGRRPCFLNDQKTDIFFFTRCTWFVATQTRFCAKLFAIPPTWWRLRWRPQRSASVMLRTPIRIDRETVGLPASGRRATKKKDRPRRSSCVADDADQ